MRTRSIWHNKARTKSRGYSWVQCFGHVNRLRVLTERDAQMLPTSEEYEERGQRLVESR